MLDSYCYSRYQRFFTTPVVGYLLRYKSLRPEHISLLACLFGLLVIPLLELDWRLMAVAALVVSGYLDTLDGSFARTANMSSARGAVLDIVFDRIVEFSVVIGLFIVDPHLRAVWCLLMLGSITICVTSFLVVSLFLSDNGEQASNNKSFYYSGGLIERSESFIFFIMMMLLPAIFYILALAFILLVTVTALLRVLWFCYWR